LAEAQELSDYRETQRVSEHDQSQTVDQGGVVKIEITGVEEAWPNVYEVDLEVLFSRTLLLPKQPRLELRDP
jgi:hypothetical protein